MNEDGIFTKRLDKLAEQYTWKAENIVRFFDKLGMTTTQKEEFLARELAGAYIQGTMLGLDQ